jgi:hypothetical protein
MKLIDQLIEAVERRREANAEVQRIMKDIQKKSDGRSTRSRKPRRKKVVAKAE